MEAGRKSNEYVTSSFSSAFGTSMHVFESGLCIFDSTTNECDHLGVQGVEIG